MLVAASMIAAATSAAPLTPEQALQRAVASGPAKAVSMGADGLRLAHTQVMSNGNASAYIFNRQDGRGYAILSADDCLAPVLGYSHSGSVDASNLPPSLKWWLDEYGRKAEWLSSKGMGSGEVQVYAPAGWSAVAPLMTTTWNQDAPYNNDCPMVGGYKAPTGCVATSFAQVMNYFEYPQRGRGTIRYTDNGVSRSLRLNKDFDWANMDDTYSPGSYTDKQAEAVAFLMQACGYAVEMGYGSEMSGAQSYKLVNGMVTYFKYSPDAIYRERELFSTAQWTEMVYNNIKNVGPVIYDGRSIDGGHSFVCDGYDGNGYFHFNWGWGGMSDGYYLLDSLNPETQGIGGAEGGFNYSQGAVFNMRKPDGVVTPDYDNLKIMGTATASLSGRDITFRASNPGATAGWANGSWRSISCEIGAIIEKEDGTKVDEVLGKWSGRSYSDVTLNVYSYYSTESTNPVITIPEGLADGRYRVVIAARQSGLLDVEQEVYYPWQPIVCNWGDANYCMLTVSGGQLSVQTAAAARLSFEGEGLSSPLYFGRNARLDLSVKNDSGMELSSCFYPALYRNGEMQYRGDYMLVTVPAGQTVHKQALAQFFQVQGATATGTGEYDLKVMDAATNSVIASYGKYEMSSVASGFVLTLDDLSVTNSTVKDLVSGNRTFKDAFEITDASNFDIKLDYTVKSGYFDSSIRVIMAQYNPETNKFVSTGENYYYDTPFIGQGESENVVIPMNMSSFDSSAIYRITAAYVQNGRNSSLGNIYIGFKDSGIDGVAIDEANGQVEYYDLQGMPVDNPSKGSVVIRRQGGKSSLIVY